MDNSPKLKSAQEARNRDEFSVALVLYEELIKESPQLADGYDGAAYCFYYLQKYNEALENSNAALAINPKLIISHVIRAYVFNRFQDVEKSRVEAKMAYDLDPNSFDALLCYGTMLVFDEKFDNAIDVLEKASKINPSNYIVHKNLAFAYLKKNDPRRLRHNIILFRLKPTVRNAVVLMGSYVSTHVWLGTLGFILLLVVALLFKSQVFLVLPAFLLIFGIIAGFRFLKLKQWKAAIRMFRSVFMVGVLIFLVYLSIRLRLSLGI